MTPSALKAWRCCFNLNACNLSFVGFNWNLHPWFFTLSSTQAIVSAYMLDPLSSPTLQPHWQPTQCSVVCRVNVWGPCTSETAKRELLKVGCWAVEAFLYATCSTACLNNFHEIAHSLFLLLPDSLFKSQRSVQRAVFVLNRRYMWMSPGLTVEPPKLPEHVRLVCFGPDTWSCVYFWVKVRSVSAALVGTRRHLLCLPLP